MLADNRLADRQSHASAFAGLFGGEEGIEDSFAIAVGDSRSAVLEQKPEILGLAGASLLRGDSKSSTGLAHSVERVDRKVDEDLLELAGLTLHHKWLCGKVRNNKDAAFLGFGLQQIQRGIDDLSHVARMPRQFAAAAEIKQHAYDLCYPIDLTDDYLEPVGSLERIGVGMQEVLGASTNYVERRADLMSEAGGQRSDRGQLVRMPQSAFQFQLALAFVSQPQLGRRQLLVEALELFSQELNFVPARVRSRLCFRGKLGDPARKFGQRLRHIAPANQRYQNGDQRHGDGARKHRVDDATAEVFVQITPLLRNQQDTRRLAILFA